MGEAARAPAREHQRDAWARRRRVEGGRGVAPPGRRDLAEPLPDPASPQALVRRLLEEEDRPAPRVDAGDSLIDEPSLVITTEETRG